MSQRYPKLSPELSEYFEHILDEIDPEVTLDQDQVDAVMDESDAALIIAGAGTGKTTTMIAKVKYLVDKLGVDPQKILVMSYARKNVYELREKINVGLDIPAHVLTFHSLGYKYIKSLFPNRHCYVVDDNRRREIFTKFFKTQVYPEHIAEFMEAIDVPTTIGYGWFYGNFFKENYEKYSSFDEYFNAYKAHKRQEVSNIDAAVENRIQELTYCEHPRTIKGEFVKSSGEAVIANYLTKNGIAYRYEKIYDEVLPDDAVYRPDFTLEIGGEEIYIEYFGIQEDYSKPYSRIYQKIRAKKEQMHHTEGKKFIALEYKANHAYLKDLEKALKDYGFKFNPISNEKVYDLLLDNNQLAELYQLETFFYRCVDAIKGSPERDRYDDVIKEELMSFSRSLGEGIDQQESLRIAKTQYYWIKRFLDFYTAELFPKEQDYGLDYADLIYFARKYIQNLDENRFKYEYILIDEYQDISLERYSLLKETVDRNRAKLIAIGDDWQSIYAFSGSRIEYMYNFKRYFPNAKELKIRRTFRNSQSLVDVAGDFVMRNDSQIKKELISGTKYNVANPFDFRPFSSEKNAPIEESEVEVLYRCIKRVHEERPSQKILVLARRNSDIKRLTTYVRTAEGRDIQYLFMDEPDTKITVMDQPGPSRVAGDEKNFSVDAMTIHKSKGLTYDWVFVVGLNQSFPMQDRDDFWIIQLFKHEKAKEAIEDAEERRVFYVALTRCKYRVVLLTDRNQKKRSKFVDELRAMVQEREDNQYL